VRVLVCGGREQHDEDYVGKSLDRLLASHGPFEQLMHGGARGVDKMAGTWARKHGILEWDFLPEWHRLNAAEGEKRNQHMLADGAPDLVVAFPGGDGTSHMIERAKASGIEVIQVASPSGSGA
jgi:YspA, cpYpsA-related SLOG family